MQRAAFPELQGRPRPYRHQRPERPDRVLIGLKVATCVAAAGLLGVIVMLATAGGTAPAARNSPAVPKIVPSPGDDAPGAGPTTTAPTQIDPPALQNDTAEIAGQPTTTTSRTPRT
ncbi:MAG: hypothetical protein LC792_28265, partial [Actinobacteria bacterium]|nr:hypothetical protein [Actinomycetota bacterium]